MKQIIRHLLLALTSLLIISSCENVNSRKEKIKKEKVTKDSLLKIKKQNDSVTISKVIKELKKKSEVKINDKKVTVLEKIKINSKLKFEFEETDYNSYYREILAERNEIFLTIKIKLTSESKAGSNPETFFPNLNVFLVNESANQIKFLGKMDYYLIKKSKLNIRYLEQIFDYKESENFICSLKIKKGDKTKLIVSVNSNNDNKINPENVISIL